MSAQVVFVGDSITAGNHVSAGQDFPSLVHASLPSITVSNIAVPSSTIDSAGQGAAADALYNAVTYSQNICCVLFGANDMVSVDGATFAATLKTFCQARAAAGFTIVVLTTLPCGSYPTAIPRSTAANALTRADTYWAALGDIGTGSGTTMGADAAVFDSSLYSDGVHPTYLGNQLIEPYVTAAISSVLVVATISPFASVFASALR